MTALNKQALREVAEKATPGRVGDRIDGSGSIKYECHGYDGSLVLRTDHKNMEYGFIGDNSNADELFFRLCVPDVILALLDELEAAEERYEDMLRQARSFREAHDYASELIRKLERNKPVVKLPTTKLWAGKVACYEECEIIALLTAAGIDVKGGW